MWNNEKSGTRSYLVLDTLKNAVKRLPLVSVVLRLPYSLLPFSSPTRNTAYIGGVWCIN